MLSYVAADLIGVYIEILLFGEFEVQTGFVEGFCRRTHLFSLPIGV